MAQAYEINLVSLVEKFNSEERCRAYLEKLRWPDGVACPRCQHTTISRIHDRDQFECDGCAYQFSVTAGTIMQDTKLPLWKWFLAVYMIVESKKGVSANQLKRTLAISYKSAWYLCQRIRKALETPDGFLRGVVEVDETYVGGVKRGGRGAGHYAENKSLVVGAVERSDGKRKSRVRMKSQGRGSTPTTKRLGQFVRANIAKDSEVYTDEHQSYPNILKDHKDHQTVPHKNDIWVVGSVHTNGVEGAWSLFKRSVVGAYHQVSCKHLPAYLDEFEFRFNNRDNPFIFRDAMRMLVDAENLEYKELVA